MTSETARTMATIQITPATGNLLDEFAKCLNNFFPSTKAQAEILASKMFHAIGFSS